MGVVGHCSRGGCRVTGVSAANTHGTVVLRIPRGYRRAVGAEHGDPVWIAPPDRDDRVRIVLSPRAAPPDAGTPDEPGGGWWRRVVPINGQRRQYGVALPPPFRDRVEAGAGAVFLPTGFGGFDVAVVRD